MLFGLPLATWIWDVGIQVLAVVVLVIVTTITIRCAED